MRDNVASAGRWLAIDQLVAERLMWPLGMVVLSELAKYPGQVVVSEQDHPVEALRLGRENPPFREGIHVGRLIAGDHWNQTGVLEDVLELVRELLVPVHDQESLAEEETVHAVGEIGQPAP